MVDECPNELLMNEWWVGNSMLIIWHDPPWYWLNEEDTYNKRDIWHDKEMM